MRITDLETRSLCDLRKSGGFCYAESPTTALLTVAWMDTDGPMNIWLPGVTSAPKPLLDLHLPGVQVHYGDAVPEELRDPTVTYVGHNSWSFDEPVFAEQLRRRGHTVELTWGDSQALALHSGLPGGLNNLSVRLWGEGKYEEGSAALKKASRESHDPPIGTLLLIAKYNCQDVRLTAALMEHLKEFPVTPFESRVMWAHRRINARGVRLDQGLTAALMRLSNEAVDAAVAQIAVLTGGFLSTHEHLRSRVKMMEWLDHMGADVGRGKGKKQVDGTISRSLAKQIVHQWIDEKIADDDTEDDGDTTGSTGKLMQVVEVLQLREAALRVTAGKLTAAGLGCGAEGYMKAIIAYFAAGTGRFGGRRFQPQNLPRPKESVDTWGLMRLYKYERFHKRPGLPVNKVLALAESRLHYLRGKGDVKTRLATLDDSASAMLRMILIPNKGDMILAADLASIESRVLAWLAGETWKMKSFWDRQDPYIEFCHKATGKRVTKKDSMRQVFKVIELGAGYQCGGNTLTLFAAAQGVDFASVGMDGDKAVDLWRDANPTIAGDIVGSVKGRKWRKGGLWNNLMDALVAACQGHVVTIRGVTFYKKYGNVHVTLPSGRDLVYRSARLGSEEVYGKQRPTVTYASPRWKEAKLYGGKVCWGDDTLILTDRGPVRIIEVTKQDRVWDGEEWVSHDGVSNNGKQEVGTWLGQSVTAGHLILDGNCWRDVTHLDDRSSMRCLRKTAASLPLLWSHLGGRETRDTTNPEIYVWSQGPSIPRTEGVHDLVNCGPRHRYTVVTPWGCVIAHNCENLVQAIARDVMCHGLVALEEAGIPVVLHVHDEAVCSAPAGRFPEFMSLVTKCPEWLPNFPLDAEGGVFPRYAKSVPDGVKEETWRNGAKLD